MFGFDPFDMDFDGDVDGIDFLGFDYLIRYVLRPYQSQNDAEELALIAQEIGAEVIRGPVRYPGSGGGLTLGMWTWRMFSGN